MFRPWFPLPLGLVLLVPSVFTLGCGSVIDTLLESDADLPIKNEAGLKALAQQFSDKVKSGDFAGAYGLCSSQLKARQTEEQFVTELKNQWQKNTGGVQPESVDLEAYMPYDDEFEEWDGMPKDIKYSQLQGQVTLSYTTMLEDEEFDIDLFAVEEGGQMRIAYLEFYDYGE